MVTFQGAGKSNQPSVDHTPRVREYALEDTRTQGHTLTHTFHITMHTHPHTMHTHTHKNTSPHTITTGSGCLT